MGFWLIDAVIIFAPSLIYIDQYRAILKPRRLGSFNPWICIILIFSMVLRSFFWIERTFDIALLYQSFLLIATQLFVLELCLRVLNQSYVELNQSSLEEPTSPNPRNFLSRLRFWHFMVYLFFFVALLKGLHTWISPNRVYTEILGSLALGLEATVPMPQCYSNYVNKSTQGVSLLLIFSWFVGDLSKIMYYLYIASPIQFVLCGILQLSVDVVIFAQIQMYNPSGYPRQSGHTRARRST